MQRLAPKSLIQLLCPLCPPSSSRPSTPHDRACCSDKQQARRAQLEAEEPSKQWPETHYLIADEEQLPLAPASVDGALGWGEGGGWRCGGVVGSSLLTDALSLLR